VTVVELPSEDLPVYRLLFLANFTALHYGPIAKTPDYRCSNNYGHQFLWRIRGLGERLTGASSSAIRANELPKCASSNIQVSVTPLNYSSEYSHVRPVLPRDARHAHHAQVVVNGISGSFTSNSGD